MRALILLLISGAAFASGDDIVQSNDNNAQTTGDVNIEQALGGDSSRALGFGHSLGDVDIAQCLGSTQWDTILGGRQKLVLNNVCMAEFYLENGLYDLAAMMLCNQPEILDEFASEQECEERHNFAPPPPPPEPATEVPTPGPQIEEIIVAQQIQAEELEEEHDDLEQRIARIEAGQRSAAHAAQERREYAQQTIDRLREDNDPEE